MRVPEDEFIALWKRLGSPELIARELGIGVRSVYERRTKIEQRRGIELPSHNSLANNRPTEFLTIPPDRRNIECTVSSGLVVVFSDAHYWPGEVTEAHQALVKVIKKLKPAAIIANGDLVDGARISRHDPLGWQQTPTMRQELEAVTDRLAEIEKVAGNAACYWPIGNHDLRFDRYLASHAPEMGGLPGTRLQDHFPRWKMCWSVRINGHTVVKHRWHNGVHAAYNNTLKSGVNLVSGHLHRLQVSAWGDYNGRRYGVDTGTLACTVGPQFEYLEGNPTPWGSGFAVLTFREDGALLPPELCEIVDEVAYFRGAAV